MLLLEARDRLGGRTWTAPWGDLRIELGGGWVHWHQPHTFSEITRGGLEVELSPEDEDDRLVRERRAAARAPPPSATRSPSEAGTASSQGVEDALPNPHDPLLAIDRLERFDRLTIAERIAQLELDDEELRRAVGRARVARPRATSRTPAPSACCAGTPCPATACA